MGKAAELRYSTSVEVRPGVRAFVGVSDVAGAPCPVAKIELNPARVLDPDGCSLAPAAAVAGVVREALSQAGCLVRLPEDLESLRVKRLDVARDFEGISSPPELLRALAPLHRPWARRNLIHADPSRNGAQTLMVGSAAGVMRAYDKHAESPEKVPEGVLRFEVEARDRWAERYGGMRRLGDVTEANVLVLARNRWEWSQMGAEVVKGPEAVRAKLARTGLSGAQQRAFIGYLWEQACGGTFDGSSHTLVKYRGLQRELGIAPAELFSSSEGVVVRLDFDSGREVVRVQAA